MDKWIGKVALVTGASVGIGAAIAKALVEHGMKVVGCSRNIQKIEVGLKDSKGSLTAIACDVSKEEQVLSMFETIKKQFGGVDVCVNNAGLGHNAPLLTGSTQQWRELYDINVLGLMMCTREAVKSMRERGVDDGAVVMISSMSGHRIINNPATHVYSSTKFAVRAITEGLRNELVALDSHIRVTMPTTVNLVLRDHPKDEYNAVFNTCGSLIQESISPGLVETEFAPRMTPDDPELGKLIYQKFPVIQPEDIADAVIFSLGQPTRTQIHDILVRPTKGVF